MNDTPLAEGMNLDVSTNDWMTVARSASAMAISGKSFKKDGTEVEERNKERYDERRNTDKERCNQSRSNNEKR